MTTGRKIIFLDTTLRDGTQSPCFDMSLADKLVVASALERLGVDIIEVGFPASSPSQYDEVQALAETIKNSAVSVLARACENDIKTAGRSIRCAARRYIHTSIPTSPIHRKFKMRKSRSVILDMAVDAVLCAKEHADFVEIGAEDSTRTEPEFLEEFCTMVTDAGADVVNIADTVGYTQPHEFYRLVTGLCRNVKAFSTGRARLSVHCHNDLGLATANTLAGIKAGAVQAEVTLTGLGERAGNAPLEEVAVVLMTRPEFFSGIYCGIVPEHFAGIARELSAITGIPSSPVKPVSGRNVGRHSSGMHQHGIISSPVTYNSDSSARFGYGEASMLLNRHSGMSGINAILNELRGRIIPGYNENELYERFKNFADKKTVLTTTDIILFFSGEQLVSSQVWTIKSCSCSMNTGAETGIFISVELVSSDRIKKNISASGHERWSVLFSMLKGAFSLDLEIVEYSFTGSGTGSKVTERCYLMLRHEGVEYGEEASGGDATALMVECFVAIVNRVLARLQIVLR